MKDFKKLGLSEELLKLLEKANFSEPSEIQEKVIPLILEGNDVIGGSATGSGKTIAFGAGIIEKTIPGKSSQVLILVPTRELAEQVGNVFIRFSGYRQLNVAIVYGGVNISNQIRSLRHSEIIVGTPGRIIDHLERGTINLSHLKVLVLDEADRMLDMGFLPDVEKIIRNCPKERQTLLFSATISPDIEKIASKYMRSPKSVSVESYVDAEKLKQIYYDVPKNLKFSLLVHLLQKEKYGLVMVFCNTRHNTNFIGNNLKDLGIDTLVIHGGLTQSKRTNIMERFNENKVYVLVCTDIAARGLDIKGVSHIYNYDIPKTSKDYIHRIGRTARAGKEGIAINLISERDYENFNDVLKDSSLSIERQETPEINVVGISLSKDVHHRGARRHERGERGERRQDRREIGGKRFGRSNGRSRYERGNDRTDRTESTDRNDSPERHRGGKRQRNRNKNRNKSGGKGRNNSRSSRNSFRGNQSRGRR